MTIKILMYIAVMAGVTYLVRMIPLVVFRKKIKSKFVQSFLFYVPYAVLGAMTFPAIFYSTGNTTASLVGLIIALLLAFFNKSLIVVALSASVGSLITLWLIEFL